MPSLASVAAPIASGGTSLGLTALGAVGGPLGMAIGAGVGALITLVGDIGSGRKTANKFTESGGPQDIINKQLAAISASSASPEEKQQATHDAWTGFIQASNQFAAQGKEQAQIAKQAIYQTPALTQTVASLGGFNPLGDQYTSQVSPSIPAATKQSGVSWKQFVAPSLAAAGGAFAGTSLARAASGAGGTAGATAPTTTIANAAGGVPGSLATAGIPGVGLQASTMGVGAVPAVAGAVPGAAAAGSTLLSKLLPTLVTGGLSLAGGLIGSNAANNAATTQANAATAAAQLEATTAANSLAFNKQVLAQQQANAQPWIDAGTKALSSIGDITSNPYTLPTAAEAAATPGYQFQFDQGQKALQAWERANGTLMSGKAIKDVINYGNNAASTNYQNVVGNSLAARSANLNPLLSVAGLGQTSTGNVNSNLSTASGTNASIAANGANAVANQNTSAAAATASGYVGSANAWNGALNNIGNAATGMLSQQQLAQLLAARQPVTVGG